MTVRISLLAAGVGVSLCLASTFAVAQATKPWEARFHPSLQNPRMLTENPGTFETWDNAECYFSAAGDRFVFQGTRDGRDCDAIYTMNADGQGIRMLSNGLGRTTCSFFAPDGESVVFSSTHLADEACPPPPDRSKGYTWALYPGYDIFRVSSEGGALTRLTSTEGYDAEAVYRPDGGRILFTSMRDGDLDLYDMKPDGSDVRRLTDVPGYDGGAFYTADGRHIVYRGRHPQGEELEEYRRLLAEHLIRPGQVDLFIMDADGQNLRQLTFDGDRGVTSWAPFPHPDGRRIVFASNRDDFDKTVPGRFGFNFELYLIEIDSLEITRLTYSDGFDGFPMFSSDGRQLVWCGNYNPARPRDTDVMLADWDEAPNP